GSRGGCVAFSIVVVVDVTTQPRRVCGANNQRQRAPVGTRRWGTNGRGAALGCRSVTSRNTSAPPIGRAGAYLPLRDTPCRAPLRPGTSEDEIRSAVRAGSGRLGGYCRPRNGGPGFDNPVSQAHSGAQRRELRTNRCRRVGAPGLRPE